jgi:hypothetical protein
MRIQTIAYLPPVLDVSTSVATVVRRSTRARHETSPHLRIAAVGDVSRPSGEQVALEASWPTLDPMALYGLPGEVVNTLRPHTESDPAALLVSFLTAAGNAMGSGPHAVADGAHHPARLFPIVVGRSSRSRKGTSWRNIHNVMREADPDWADARVLSGLSSGEGLIAAVGDGEETRDGEIVGAVEDKRLLVVEQEFSRVLTVKAREANTLSAIVRDAYDNGDLRSMTKRPLVATGAHVGLLGHITIPELRRSLTETDMANGFGNRFLWVLARRGPLLPNGGNMDDRELTRLGQTVADALARGRRLGRMSRSPEAEVRWETVYRELAAEDECEGLAETLLARGEAQLLRLSLIYAALDGSARIELSHLRAAEAVWRYCAASVRYIFGEATGDPVAERILAAVTKAGPDGLDRAAQSDLFQRHHPAKRLEQARNLLLARHAVAEVQQVTDGRSRHVLKLAKYANEANEAP